MAIKVITGKPGSGKTAYAVQNLIAKHFKFDEEIHEWKNETGVVIISNINGLKLPHLNFDRYLLENKITFRQFFTENYFKKILIPKYEKVAILLDEAQKHFPYNFKDVRGAEDNPEELSNFYFFEHHRHNSTDVYLIGQLWNRFSPNIVNLAEYQIDAQPRSLSIAGEFTYFFMNGMDIVERKRIKIKKRIFALYKSTETEEVKGAEIRPTRKLAIIVLVGIVITVFLFRFLIHSIMPDDPQDNDSSSVHASTSVETSTSLSSKTSAIASGRRTEVAVGPARQSAEPYIQPEIPDRIITVPLGGIWVGTNLVGIEFFGSVVPVRDFTYSYSVDNKNLKVYARVPTSILGKVQRLQTGDFYQDGENWYQIAAENEYMEKAQSKVDKGEMRASDVTPFTSENKTSQLASVTQ